MKTFLEQIYKNKYWYFVNILLVIGIYYSSNIYDLTNHSTAHVHILQTFLDRMIPFVPQFIVVYNSLVPVIYGTIIFFFLFHPRIFASFSLSMISLFLISNLVYIFYQTYVPRPTLISHKNWFIDQVIILYSKDNPYNCFPSLHCGTSTLVALVWFVKKKYRIVAWIILVWAVSVILATQFLKQHVLIDISGSFLAMIIFYFYYKLFHLNEER